MIIAVQGTHYGNNESVKVLNALAVMGVAGDQMTTMILQFTNKTRKSAEEYLIGKTLKNESLVQDASVPDISSGMDALCAHVLGQDDNARFFSEVSRSLVVLKDKDMGKQSRNLFDLVTCSRKPSFETEILTKQQRSRTSATQASGEAGDTESDNDMDYLEHLLDSINNVYQVVYVLMPSKNQALCQELLRYADVNIICLHQGNPEPATTIDTSLRGNENKRNLYVVTDYCSGSMYSSKAMAQAYGQKIVYSCMHNIQYNDACANGTALDYLKDNLSADKKSAGYSFMSNIEVLYNALMRKTGRKTTDVDLSEVPVYTGPKFIRVNWSSVTEPVVRQVATSGVFRKTTTSYAELTDDGKQRYPAEEFVEMGSAPAKNAADDMFYMDEVFEEESEPSMNNVQPQPVMQQDTPDLFPAFETFPDKENELEEVNEFEEVSDSEWETAGMDTDDSESFEEEQKESIFETIPQSEPAPAAEKPAKKGLFGLFGGSKKKGQDDEQPLPAAPAFGEIDPIAEAQKFTAMPEQPDEFDDFDEYDEDPLGLDFDEPQETPVISKEANIIKPTISTPIEIPDIFSEENDVEESEAPIAPPKKLKKSQNMQAEETTQEKPKRKKPTASSETTTAADNGVAEVITPQRPKKKAQKKSKPADTETSETNNDDDWVIG